MIILTILQRTFDNIATDKFIIMQFFKLLVLQKKKKMVNKIVDSVLYIFELLIIKLNLISNLTPVIDKMCFN